MSVCVRVNFTSAPTLTAICVNSASFIVDYISSPSVNTRVNLTYHAALIGVCDIRKGVRSTLLRSDGAP